MDLRTYRAKSLAEALRLVREDLGPDASLLHTRQVASAAWPWPLGGVEVEVTASCEVQVPSRISDSLQPIDAPRADLLNFRSQFRRHLRDKHVGASVEELAGLDCWPGNVDQDPARIR